MLALSLALLLLWNTVQSQTEWNKCQCTYFESTADCICRKGSETRTVGTSVIFSDLCQSNSSIESLTITHEDHIQNVSDKLYPNSSGCVWNKVIRLQVYKTNLTQLRATSLTGIPNLKSFELSHNPRLHTYGEGAFSTVGHSLSSLIAKSNQVRSLTRKVFDGLTRLERLILSDNKIGYIEMGVFSSGGCCSGLRELRLDQNILTVFDANSFSGLKRLEILDLRNNPIQQLAANVFQPFSSTLYELRMSHDDQTSFGGFSSPPDGLFSKLTRLTVLQVDELKIKNITRETFEDLQNLNSLSLRGNRLTQMSFDVFEHLKKLKHLDLSLNRLVCIPSSLNESPVEFLSGLNLQSVDLSWNHLTHLNRLTSQSLGLFDYQSPSSMMFLLNLTGNPWQHIDEDTFCNPISSTVIRPSHIIFGPLPPVSSRIVRTSLGLWHARASWPDGPLALIGRSSRLYGLMVGDDSLTPRLVTSTIDETGNPVHKTALVGSENASDLCKQLKLRNHHDDVLNENQTDFTVVPVTKMVKKHSPMDIVFSLSSHCPSLSVHELQDWELAQLNVSSVPGLFNFWLNSSTEQNSRFYLLIIAAVCVAFLLVALTVIMCYRTWSRRLAHKSNGHDFEHYPNNQPTMVNQFEKQLLLNGTQFTVSEHPLVTKPANGKAAPLNNHSIVDACDQAKDSNREQISLTMNESTAANNRTSAVIFPPVLRYNNRNERPKSDSDAVDLDDGGQLTSLGVV